MKQLNFAKIKKTLDIPDLLDLQKRSFKDFLQLDVKPSERKIQGLQAAFEDVFPIEAPDGSMKLDFLRYEFGEPRYITPEEAIVRDGTYFVPLKAWLSLSVKKAGKLKQISEQDVTLCELPVMTETGCFIFNGAERVVVSQLHRSPGVIFEEDEEKKQSVSGKKLYFARIIPYRGAWVEFEFDAANVLWARLDRKKKILATSFLRACGIDTNSKILQIFYPFEEIEVKPANVESVVGKYAVEDIVDMNTGEVLWNLDDQAAVPIDDQIFKKMLERGIKKIKVISGDPRRDNPAILATLENKKDHAKTPEEARQDIYKKLRGQDFVVKEQVDGFLDNFIFNNLRRYDLSHVGRYKMAKKLGPLYKQLSRITADFKVPGDDRRTLCLEDIIVTMQYLLYLNSGVANVTVDGKLFNFELDDIDHLGNRRVRGIGELLENQIRVGLSQMSKTVRDAMGKEDIVPTPRSLVNAQPVHKIIKKFFGTSQLSQFMDQINPLAELTHKRRLSALGPGGLNRKRAGFEVRDVHHTHYGRICPIETPEGPNIGLIMSLACYARVNEYGLLEAPYKRVEGTKVSTKVDYLTADTEDEFTVAQANTPVDKANKIATDAVYTRYRDDYPIVKPEQVEYMDISPLEVISISAALIPFLEHDDANRALMGCNMQRQAVPLLFTEYPLVGTGVEDAVAKDSGSALAAKRDGKVIFSSGEIIAVQTDDKHSPVDIYRLTKYKRSNQNTCINQIPYVKTGAVVKAGDIIADGPSTKDGQLALGRNLLVAFLSWEGYNYEDAVLVSEKLVKEDIFTSVHLHEFEVVARSTQIGPEEITKDIPNVGASALAHLDENGIVVPSTVVEQGDILVGKVTPKGEQQATPEVRLLKVIFGKKAEDVVDSSLRVPPGVSGKVIGTRIFVRKEKLTKIEEKARSVEFLAAKEKTLADLKSQKEAAFANLKENKELSAADRKKEEERTALFFKMMEKRAEDDYNRNVELAKQGDDLPLSVNKSVKVYIASKRKLQVGDKVSGRHGNKGVVSKIMAEEDMPFMPDGTPIDVVLSPLGIPSRMNVGQLFETMLGWAGKQLNTQMVCPVFDGPTEDDVKAKINEAREYLMKEKGMPESYLPDEYCRIKLFDGRTGEAFVEKVTIGYMYMMKLNHLVEDKVHARSTGPYALITRQPLGGKAQFGGQRFGEMEVWAIEGYGATYVLQEFLTVKSDDFVGRTKMYEAIIRGDSPQAPGVPESFKVLIKELQALGLSVDLLKTASDDDDTGVEVSAAAQPEKTAKAAN